MWLSRLNIYRFRGTLVCRDANVIDVSRSQIELSQEWDQIASRTLIELDVPEKRGTFSHTHLFPTHPGCRRFRCPNLMMSVSLTSFIFKDFFLVMREFWLQVVFNRRILIFKVFLMWLCCWWLRKTSKINIKKKYYYNFQIR